MDISARALLVNITVRVWTGEKRDRALTRKICTMKGAEDNSVRANKSLLGMHIHGVQAAERAVRHAVNERTLPWMDDGTRILKGSVFMAFTEAMAEPIRLFKDAVAAAAKLPDCTGKVTVLGYCLGALMTFLTAVRYGVDAAVVYHGGDTEKYLDEVDGLDAPLLMHLGEEDEFISKPAQAEIKAALARKPNVTVYSYPGQYHAFSRHNGAHYNVAAAALANSRTHDFLNRQLR